ncbi:MAG: WD40 repeat domain-containing protein [Caulobacteraceae bacterium]
MVALIGLFAISTCGCSSPKVQSQNFPFKVKEEFEVSTPGAAVAVNWSPDGSRLAAASDYGGVLTVWDASGHRVSQMQKIGGGPNLWGSLSFVRGNSELLFQPPGDADADAAFSIWDVATGKLIDTVEGPDSGGGRPNLAAWFAISSDQSLLAVANNYRGRNLFLYDTRTWRFLRGYRLEQGADSLAIFGSDRSVAIGSLRSELAVLDTSKAAPPRQYQVYPLSRYGDFPVEAVAGSPDGKLILGGVGLIVFFEANLTAPPVVAWRHSFDPVWVLRRSDGARIASFKLASPPIRAAAWDPKGRYVAILDQLGRLFVWRPLAPVLSYSEIDAGGELSLAISPDGRRIAVTTSNGVTVYTIG